MPTSEWTPPEGRVRCYTHVNVNLRPRQENEKGPAMLRQRKHRTIMWRLEGDPRYNARRSSCKARLRAPRNQTRPQQCSMTTDRKGNHNHRHGIAKICALDCALLPAPHAAPCRRLLLVDADTELHAQPAPDIISYWSRLRETTGSDLLGKSC